MSTSNNSNSSSPIQLGYLVPEFPAQTHAFFWREIEALKKLEMNVHLVSTRRPDPDACKHDFASTASQSTHYVYPPGFSSLSYLLRHPISLMRSIIYVFSLNETTLAARLKYLGLIPCAAELVQHAQASRYDHIHVHSCGDAAHVAALANILGGLSYSLTLHGDLPVYGVNHSRKMARASVVICVTRQLKEQIIQSVGLPDHRIAVVWMGVNTDEFLAEHERQKNGDKIQAVTVARLNPTKGHVYALRAIRKAVDSGCDIHYDIAGEGPHRSEIEEEIQRLDLQDRVRMHGTLGEGAVLRLLTQADIFILPSVGLGEAAPVSVMEAMSCELPVIASVIGGTPDMISSEIDGILVPQADVPALSEALIRLARDPIIRSRMGLAARARAVRQFDFRYTTRQLLDAITIQRHNHTANGSQQY